MFLFLIFHFVQTPMFQSIGMLSYAFFNIISGSSGYLLQILFPVRQSSSKTQQNWLCICINLVEFKVFTDSPFAEKASDFGLLYRNG